MLRAQRDEARKERDEARALVLGLIDDFDENCDHDADDEPKCNMMRAKDARAAWEKEP